MNGKPVSVPDEHTAAVRTMVEQRLPSDPHPYLSEGMRVRIKRGLLAGAEGILVAKKPKHRLVISVDLMRHGVAVDVDKASGSHPSQRTCGQYVVCWTQTPNRV